MKISSAIAGFTLVVHGGELAQRRENGSCAYPDKNVAVDEAGRPTTV